ncbi:MAG TPA: HAD-IA family hydrolase [Steroidobacteraceae bacterium]|nr:HAD-IA family hydrolase [Steroidobacteraceae bacterium]
MLLFDVGGVLVELGGVATLLGWLEDRITLQELWSLWLHSPSVRAFESGRIEARQFAAGVLAELRLDIDAGQFLESFARWPSALYPGALEMIGRIPSHYRRALLSNSNVLHWQRVLDQLGLGAVFQHRFASHLMGKIKPDAEAFEHVIDALDCRAAQILFLDDNALNVEAARNIGMRAQLVRGTEQAQLALQQAGVITAC